MNCEELSAKFRKPAAPPVEAGTCGPTGEVVLAGTVVSVTPAVCSIDINGAQYEIAAKDITDIQLLSVALPGARKPTEIDEVSPTDIVLFKMSAATVLTLRIPVQAVIVAAGGTWVSIQAMGATAAPTAAAQQKPTG